MSKSFKQPKNVPLDGDWPDEEVGYRGVKSFGRRVDKGSKKSYRFTRGGGAATKGKKHLAD